MREQLLFHKAGIFFSSSDQCCNLLRYQLLKDFVIGAFKTGRLILFN